MSRPLVRRAFALAERLGGMTAFELMARMTHEELMLWDEYDRINIPQWNYPFAAMMAKLDWIKGVKHPDPSRYLPRPAKTGKKRTYAQIKACFDIAAANSTRCKERPPHHGR
jgi:hypothetical protein